MATAKVEQKIVLRETTETEVVLRMSESEANYLLSFILKHTPEGSGPVTAALRAALNQPAYTPSVPRQTQCY